MSQISIHTQPPFCKSAIHSEDIRFPEPTVGFTSVTGSRSERKISHR